MHFKVDNRVLVIIANDFDEISQNLDKVSDNVINFMKRFKTDAVTTPVKINFPGHTSSILNLSAILGKKEKERINKYIDPRYNKFIL